MERSALAALQAHLRQAAALQHPRMSAEAMALLSGYFLMIRAAEESPQGVLASLARVASASARLCLRADVLPFPDAAVAVAFMEEQLSARVSGAYTWGGGAGASPGCCCHGACIHHCVRGLSTRCKF